MEMVFKEGRLFSKDYQPLFVIQPAKFGKRQTIKLDYQTSLLLDAGILSLVISLPSKNAQYFVTHFCDLQKSLTLKKPAYNLMFYIEY